MMLPNQTVVIGHYPEYVELAKKLKAKIFNMPLEVWNTMNKAQQWAANQKFLDKAIKCKSEFVLATPYDKIKAGSWLSKEVSYLLKHGYKWVEDMTKLIIE